MKDYKFKINGQDYAASVEEQDNGTLNVTVNGKTYQVELPEKAHHCTHPMVRPAVSAAAGAPAVFRAADRRIRQSGCHRVKRLRSDRPGVFADGRRRGAGFTGRHR